MIDMMPAVVSVMTAPQSYAVALEEADALHESGLLHRKEGGRYQVVETLPKEADSFDGAFDYADAFGTLRVGWIKTDLGLPEKRDATSLGGQFGFQTAAYQGFSVRVAAYTSNRVPALSDDAPYPCAFFDENCESFTYIGEASIEYLHTNIFATGGRFRIDTPYADSDDIRMAPNSFEGLWGFIELSESVRANAYVLTRWAGFDSGDDQQRFKPFFQNPHSGRQSDGILGLSLQYSVNAVNDLSVWYYHVDAMADILYTEAAGDVAFSDAFHFEYGLQASAIFERETSGVDGNAVGAMMILDAGVVFGGGAFNAAYVKDGSAVTDGFGGGPYYTSLDESTIGFVSGAAPGEDVFSYRFGGGVNFESFGAEGLVVEYVYGNLRSEDSIDFIEQDAVLTYEMTQKLTLEGVFAHFVIDKAPEEIDAERFDRFVVRLDYNF